MRGRAFWMLTYAVAFAAAVVLFQGHPALDLQLSGFFWRADGFALRAPGIWQALGLLQIVASGGLVSLALGCWLLALRRDRSVPQLPGRVWGFILLLYLVGPGLLVNGLLKRFSGRARPVAIEEFGGTGQFTPAWSFADQCRTNCSFVSAEVASCTALALSLIVAARVSGGRTWQALAWLAVALLPLIMVQRIGSGRHFLSDTVFAVLLVAGVGLILSVLCRINREPRPVATFLNISKP